MMPGIKRCHVENAIIEKPCPRCGVIASTDLNDNYLSYPEVGKEMLINLVCFGCEAQWELEFDEKDEVPDWGFEISVPVKIVAATMILEY